MRVISASAPQKSSARVCVARTLHHLFDAGHAVPDQENSAACQPFDDKPVVCSASLARCPNALERSGSDIIGSHQRVGVMLAPVKRGERSGRGKRTVMAVYSAEDEVAYHPFASATSREASHLSQRICEEIERPPASCQATPIRCGYGWPAPELAPVTHPS